MINHLFQSDAISIGIDMLTPSKSLPINIKKSKKYSQIKKTLGIVGLIEPVIVFIDKTTNKIKIVDGHLRVEALRDLGRKEVKCLISTIYDTYTPNNKVNRITIIEEQKMIRQAIKKGVSVDILSEALDISIDSLKEKLTILDNVSHEVISLLSNHHVPKATFYVLKKMKPMRQIECANLMVTLDNFSLKFITSLLHRTDPVLLIAGRKEIALQKEGHRQAIDRLERELAQVNIDADKLKESYALNLLGF